MRKKSIKKHLEIGSVIIIKTGGMYKVTELLKQKFICEPIPVLCEIVNDYRQEFYYNIEMTIYNKAASNWAE